MKWYFACNDKSEEFFPLIKAAVSSALENTTLKPHFIYDGAENELTEWLREHNVKIINHKVSFYDALENFYNENALKIASGTFLRCDIPIIEKEDDFVLYTDCDILFLKDFETNLKPKYFACSSQNQKHNFRHFNAGVMLMNVKTLRESHSKFVGFIEQNIKRLHVFDQTAYQIFYDNKASKLPIIYNHKPYWGIEEKAVILHFHGAKPINFASEEKLKHLPFVYYKLYRKNPKAYDYYLKLFKKYSPSIEYSQEGIKKLKSGEYPLINISKSSFIQRLRNKISKEYNIYVQKFK